MDAKTYCKKTAAFAGWLIQNVPGDLDEETMDSWMDNPDRTKKFLSGLKPPKPAPAKPIQLFSVFATTPLDAVAGKPTKKCFTDSRWGYRDPDFDNWLRADQFDADACVITTLAPSRSWTFVEAAQAVLGDANTTDTVALGNELIRRGHPLTLPQDEEMVEKTENGVKTGMSVDAYGNFCFVETGNPENPVSVARVHRDDPRWRADVGRLGNGSRWYAGHRLLVRNLDASKL